MKKYVTINIEKERVEELNKCEILYRKYHPEFNNMKLTKSKIMYEIIKFYLRGTEHAIN